jgi:hypothetical protein
MHLRGSIVCFCVVPYGILLEISETAATWHRYLLIVMSKHDGAYCTAAVVEAVWFLTDHGLMCIGHPPIAV